MAEVLEKTATFFFPNEQPKHNLRFSGARRLVQKQETQTNQLGLSIPSTTDTRNKATSSKPNSAQSGLPEQYTPPQVCAGRKRSDLHQHSDDRKPMNYRILSSNLNQRTSYPPNETKMLSFGQQFLYDNEFIESNQKPVQQTKTGNSGVVSPTKPSSKLPDIFMATNQRGQKNSSQGFRIHSGKESKRATMSNFVQQPASTDKKAIERKYLQFPVPKQPQLRATQSKLPQLGQQGVPYIQTRQQMKIINRIFSGKQDI